MTPSLPQDLIQLQRALASQYWAFQVAHWNAAVYGDHKLYAKLYTAAGEELDNLTEFMLGLYPNAPIHEPPGRCGFDREALDVQSGVVLRICQRLADANPPAEIANLVGGIAERHVKVRYLLRQAQR